MKAVERIQSAAELVKFYEAQKNWNKENVIAFLDKKYELCEKFGFECLDDFEGFDDDGFGDWCEYSYNGDSFWNELTDDWDRWIGWKIEEENFVAARKHGFGVYNHAKLLAFLRRYGLTLQDSAIREIYYYELPISEDVDQYRKKRKKAGMRQ